MFQFGRHQAKSPASERQSLVEQSSNPNQNTGQKQEGVRASFLRSIPIKPASNALEQLRSGKFAFTNPGGRRNATLVADFTAKDTGDIFSQTLQHSKEEPCFDSNNEAVTQP